ncbi:hypothetical protein lse_0676 [Listeria seeligeri serovar 1/2b str. SLCC3954]|nr:hypothetical protein lse_0676 [Listeria seeligeri serovar 1/2b str. SLCC3954]
MIRIATWIQSKKSLKNTPTYIEIREYEQPIQAKRKIENDEKKKKLIG